jgi:hypothetical protein
LIFIIFAYHSIDLTPQQLHIRNSVRSIGAHRGALI